MSSRKVISLKTSRVRAHSKIYGIVLLALQFLLLIIGFLYSLRSNSWDKKIIQCKGELVGESVFEEYGNNVLQASPEVAGLGLGAQANLTPSDKRKQRTTLSRTWLTHQEQEESVPLLCFRDTKDFTHICLNCYLW